MCWRSDASVMVHMKLCVFCFVLGRGLGKAEVSGKVGDKKDEKEGVVLFVKNGMYIRRGKPCRLWS